MDHRLFLTQDYALVNPLQVDLGLWRDIQLLPLVPKSLSRQKHLMPHLAVLRDLPYERRLALLETSEDWAREQDFPFFSALLQTPAASKRLAAHLTGRMLHESPTGGSYWIRYHDPRVFKHLCWLLNEQQMGWLLGPILTWTWHDPLTGAWVTDQKKENVPATSGMPAMTSAQWDGLHRMEQLNITLLQISRSSDGYALAGDYARVIDQFLKIAIEQAGLQEADDQRLYAKHAFRYGPRWHDHPALKVCIERARNGECSYTEGCNALDPNILRIA